MSRPVSRWHSINSCRVFEYDSKRFIPNIETCKPSHFHSWPSRSRRRWCKFSLSETLSSWEKDSFADEEGFKITVTSPKTVENFLAVFFILIIFRLSAFCQNKALSSQKFSTEKWSSLTRFRELWQRLLGFFVYPPLTIVPPDFNVSFVRSRISNG